MLSFGPVFHERISDIGSVTQYLFSWMRHIQTTILLPVYSYAISRMVVPQSGTTTVLAPRNAGVRDWRITHCKTQRPN